MNIEEALAILGLSADCSLRTAEKAYQVKWDECNVTVDHAKTSHERQQSLQQMQRLDAAMATLRSILNDTTNHTGTFSQYTSQKAAPPPPTAADEAIDKTVVVPSGQSPREPQSAADNDKTVIAPSPAQHLPTTPPAAPQPPAANIDLELNETQMAGPAPEPSDKHLPDLDDAHPTVAVASSRDQQLADALDQALADKQGNKLFDQEDNTTYFAMRKDEVENATDAGQHSPPVTPTPATPHDYHLEQGASPDLDIDKTMVGDAEAIAKNISAQPKPAGNDQGEMLNIGQTLVHDRYTITAFIDKGGMGEVYRARDNIRSEEIALKVLLPGLDDEAKERFFNEALLSSQLSHQHIVNVYDVQKDGDNFFMCMELLEGENLRTLMRRRQRSQQRFSQQEVLDLAIPICDALSYAHRNIIHRDIKPENIWLGKNGDVKLMDFGIARTLSSSQCILTRTVTGSVRYMAPEQLDGVNDSDLREIDSRADQYALAVVLYELLTGETPAGRIKSLLSQRPDIERSFANSIDKALEGRPDDRFPNIIAFKTALSSKGGRFNVKVPKLQPKRFSKEMIGLGASVVVLGAVLSLFGGDSSDTPLPPPTAALISDSGDSKESSPSGSSSNTPMTSTVTPLTSLQSRADALKKQHWQMESEVQQSEQQVLQLNRQLKDAKGKRAQRQLKAQIEIAEQKLEQQHSLQALVEKQIFNQPSYLGLQPRIAEINTLQANGNNEQAAPVIAAMESDLNNLSKQMDAASNLLLLENRVSQERNNYLKRLKAQKLDKMSWATESDSLYQEAIDSRNSGSFSTAEGIYTTLLENYQGISKQLVDIELAKDEMEQAERKWLRLKKIYGLKDPKQIRRAETALDKIEENLKLGALEPVAASYRKAAALYVQGRTSDYVNNQVAAENQRKKDNRASAERGRTSKSEKQQYLDSITPIMVTIPKGSFEMGDPSGLGDKDEQPVHSVKVKRAFKLSKYEVTFDEYDQFAEATGRTLPDDEGWGRGKRPVINVSWEDAVAYTHWLNKEHGIKRGGFRLPSEAEWEYAARAGSSNQFSSGDCLSTDEANFNGNSDWNNCSSADVYRQKTLPVGHFRPNAFGLYDMHGNVSEWVQDCSHSSYQGAPKTSVAWTKGNCSIRFSRGGAWSDNMVDLRSASRDWHRTGYQSFSLGFRIAR